MYIKRMMQAFLLTKSLRILEKKNKVKLVESEFNIMVTCYLLHKDNRDITIKNVFDKMNLCAKGRKACFVTAKMQELYNKGLLSKREGKHINNLTGMPYYIFEPTPLFFETINNIEKILRRVRHDY